MDEYNDEQGLAIEDAYEGQEKYPFGFYGLSCRQIVFIHLLLLILSYIRRNVKFESLQATSV